MAEIAKALQQKTDLFSPAQDALIRARWPENVGHAYFGYL
jgi:hypothetical protein